MRSSHPCAAQVQRAHALAKILARLGFDSDRPAKRNGPSPNEDRDAVKFLERERVAVHRALRDRRDALFRLADALFHRHNLDDPAIRAIYDAAEKRRKTVPVLRWVHDVRERANPAGPLLA